MTGSTPLPRTLVNQMLRHAQSSPRAEVCGLVAARDGTPVRYLPIDNVADAPERLFRMDAAQQIDALRALREAGESLFAIFHSHPGAPARPSERDLREAGYPQALYLIASLNTRGVLEMRAYRLRDGQALEVPLEIY